MTRFNTRIILPIVTTGIGALWVLVGLIDHGWWVNGKPASGFFPTIIGALLVVVSVLVVIGESKVDPPGFIVSHLHPLMAAVAVVLLALLIGFFPALTLYVFLWLKVYEKHTWVFSLLTTAITIGAMFGIFSLWLSVLFPRGALVELVLR